MMLSMNPARGTMHAPKVMGTATKISRLAMNRSDSVSPSGRWGTAFSALSACRCRSSIYSRAAPSAMVPPSSAPAAPKATPPCRMPK